MGNSQDIGSAMASRFPRPGAKPNPRDFASHWNPWDVDERNVSLIPGTSNMVIHDAGALGGKDVMALLHSGMDYGPEMSRELMRSGAPDAIRQAMAQSLSRGPQGGVPVPPHLMQARLDQIAQLKALIEQLRAGGQASRFPLRAEPQGLEGVLAAFEGGYS